MTFDEGQVRRDGVLVRKFGSPVHYTETGQGTTTVIGVFENPTRQSQVGQRPVSQKFPMISVLRSQVPNLRKGDLFQIPINGIDYRCKEAAIDEGEIVIAKLEVLK